MMTSLTWVRSNDSDKLKASVWCRDAEKWIIIQFVNVYNRKSNSVQFRINFPLCYTTELNFQLLIFIKSICADVIEYFLVVGISTKDLQIFVMFIIMYWCTLKYLPKYIIHHTHTHVKPPTFIYDFRRLSSREAVLEDKEHWNWKWAALTVKKC